MSGNNSSFDLDVFYNITLYFDEKNVVAYKIYQIFAFISLFFSFAAFIYLIFKECPVFGHNTAKIIAIGYKMTKIIQSSMALALTTLLVNFHYSIFFPCILYLHSFIYVASLQFCLFSLLMVIDIAVRSHIKCCNYGSNLFSIIFILALIIFTIGLSFLIWYIVGLCSYNYFIIVFICVNGLLHLNNVVLAIYLTKIVKEMRRKSVLSSSLTERHECSKNLELLQHLLPKIIIGLACGTLSLLGSLTANYIIPSGPYVGYVACYNWYEIGSISTSGFELWLGIKHRFCDKQNTIRTISKRIATVQTVDDHIESLKQIWEK